MAKIGDQLLQPEEGWRRVEESDQSITYIGENWSNHNLSNYSGGYIKYTESIPASISFYFYGDKIRFIGRLWNSAYSTEIKVYINGKYEGSFSQLGSERKHQVLNFQKTNLPKGKKNIVFEAINGSAFMIDAIDIDKDDRLFHINEVTDLQDLEIGKRIRCHYQAVSGQVGVFSNLGKETSDFIPSESSAIPNGDFYFICVDRDHLGRWKLIADRNIQHSISWDTLNSAGIASGSGHETIFDSIVLDSNSINSGNIGSDMLSFTSQNSSSRVRATEGKISGKWYWEVTKISGGNYSRMIGVCSQNWSDIRLDAYNGLLSWGKNSKTLTTPFNGVGSTLGIALDLDNKFVDFYIDGELSGRVEEQLIGLQGRIYPYSLSGSNMSGINWRFNFGANPFKYSIPKGFLPYGFKEKKAEYTVRLLTGGVLSTDKDNEWDKYIVKSDLEGRVTPGDNNVWNWNNNSPSWTSTTQTNALRRVRRGGAGEGVGAYYGDRAVFSETSRAGDSSGFRPVLLIENLLEAAVISDRDSYLISRDGQVGMNLIIKPTMDDFKWMLTARIDQKVFYISEDYEGEQALIVKIPPHLFESIEEKEVTIEFWVNEKIRNTLVVKAKIANQTPTIEMSLNEYTLKIDIVDADGDPFYYEIKLNKKELLSSGSVIGATRLTKYLNSSNLLIGQQNEIEVRVVDHYGGKDSRVLTFEGKYHGLMFSDERGEFYSNDLGEILKKLMISGVYAGEDSDIFTIKLINTHNYPIKDLKLLIDYYEPTNGTDISISKSNDPYKGDDVLAYSEEIASEDAVTFYLQLHTLEGSVGTGKFKVRATARRAS